MRKIAAYQTLYTCLLTISKPGAPIAPFFMDKLYRDLTVATQTENLTVYIWRISVENYVNKILESKMQKAQTISSLVLSLRKRNDKGTPTTKVMIPVLDDNQRVELKLFLT
jgi:isoleucyl-tRNA synthetase